MTDEDFDDMHHGYQDDPAVQAAKQQLADAIDAARQRTKDAQQAAAQAEIERRAKDPRYTRDFDRTECWPECKPDPRAHNPNWMHHTHDLGFCAEAHRPKTPHLAAFVELEAHLEEEERRYFGGGMNSFKAADMALVWLADHPELIPHIWPDSA